VTSVFSDATVDLFTYCRKHNVALLQTSTSARRTERFVSTVNASTLLAATDASAIADINCHQMALSASVCHDSRLNHYLKYCHRNSEQKDGLGTYSDNVLITFIGCIVYLN